MRKLCSLATQPSCSQCEGQVPALARSQAVGMASNCHLRQHCMQIPLQLLGRWTAHSLTNGVGGCYCIHLQRRA